MPLRFLNDSDYSLGMIRDLPPVEIPSGGVYDSSNMLADYPGILRQRGGSTALVSGSQTAFATSLGFCYSQDATTIEELYGMNGKTGVISSINKSTGAATTVATRTAGTVGRPVRHFGFLVFPNVTAAGVRQGVAVAGSTVSTSFSITANLTVTAGAQQLTMGGADTTTNVKVGSVVWLEDSATNAYTGRVVSVDSSTKFTVWPTPTVTFTAIASVVTSAPTYLSATGGVCATSFQNRLLYGNTMDLSSTTQSLISDRRVYYSPLPTEGSTLGFVSARISSGASFLDTNYWPALNWFEVSGADPIVAMEPTSDSDLLILTSTHPVLFRGNLVTELSTTSAAIPYDLSDVNQPYGCLSDLSVQRTSRGIIWAGSGGVYAYDGSSFHTLTGDRQNRRIANYWRSLSAGGASIVIHGSFYARNHYVVSGISGGTTPFALVCNLDNLQWGRLTGVGSDNFYGLAQPTQPSNVFALRWWNQGGTAPSMTNGQTIRVETMFDPDVPGATRLDADGATVTWSVTPRPIGGNLTTQKMFQRGTIRYQCESDTTAVSVQAQSRVDPGDVNSGALRTLTSLSSTVVRSISAATNASPIAITTTASHGWSTGDYVNIDAVGGNTNANGRYRITRTGATTFTLDGSTGNANYTAGGAAQKITETDVALNGVNKGQAITFTLGSSATNRFELHGVTVGFLESNPVMST